MGGEGSGRTSWHRNRWKTLLSPAHLNLLTSSDVRVEILMRTLRSGHQVVHLLLETGQAWLLLLLPTHQHCLQVSEQLQRLCLLDQLSRLWQTWKSRLLPPLLLLLLGKKVVEGRGCHHAGGQGCLRLEVGQGLAEGGLGGRN